MHFVFRTPPFVYQGLHLVMLMSAILLFVGLSRSNELTALKAQPGGAVYVVGGPGLVRTLIDEALLDELRLIVHPVALGAGTGLFDGIARRPALTLVDSEPTASGRVNLTYRVMASTPANVQ